MKHNWHKAPSWANYAAICAFSGNREWFRSEPRSPGWVEVEARPVDGDANESKWSTIVPEGYRQPAKWPKNLAAIAHGEYGVKWMGLVADPATEPDEHTEAGMAFIAGRLAEYKQHAEELAEALEEALIYSDGVTCEQHEEWKGALRRYKQSRGE